LDVLNLFSLELAEWPIRARFWLEWGFHPHKNYSVTCRTYEYRQGRNGCIVDALLPSKGSFQGPNLEEK